MLSYWKVCSGQTLVNAWSSSFAGGQKQHVIGGMKSIETSPRATPENRRKLYSEWRPMWNVSKPYLMEKAPRRLWHTRLMQYYFNADQTYFFATVKHPFGEMRSFWEDATRWNDTKSGDVCGSATLKWWLGLLDQLYVDLPFLKHFKFIYHELFCKADRTQGNMLACIVIW